MAAECSNSRPLLARSISVDEMETQIHLDVADTLAAQELALEIPASQPLPAQPSAPELHRTSGCPDSPLPSAEELSVPHGEVENGQPKEVLEMDNSNAEPSSSVMGPSDEPAADQPGESGDPADGMEDAEGMETDAAADGLPRISPEKDGWFCFLCSHSSNLKVF